jgi:transcriptional regulator with XRE-family HTH domain
MTAHSSRAEAGARIKAWLEHLGMTMTALAEKLDISVSAVSLWISGGTEPTLDNLRGVVHAFGITMERFWGELPKRNRKRERKAS